MPPNPRQNVTGPTFAPLPYGILSVAQVVDDADPHWRNGIEWEAECSPIASATLASCYAVLDPDAEDQDAPLIEADPPAKTPRQNGVPYLEGDAFTLYAVHQCAPVGRTEEQDIARAGRLLTNGEGRGLDRVLLTGVTEAGVLPHSLVAQAEAADENPNPIDIALGVLEAQIAHQYGGVGVIYLPRMLALAAFSRSLLVGNGQRLTTATGTPVALVDVVELGEEFALTAFATGALTVHRGAVQTLPALDRLTNTRTVIAERSYAVGWDCPTVYADIDVATLIPPDPEA